MRLDQRRPDELRPVSFTIDTASFAEGSVIVSMGKTRVLCNLTVEEGVPRWMQIQGKPGGWLTAEYALLPRSTTKRTPRETMGLGGRTQEIRRLISRSLRAAVDLEKIGSRTLILDCDVLQADGGTRTASITGGYLALALCIKKLAQAGIIPAQALIGSVAAISAGVVDGTPLLDLNYQEDSSAEVDANFVMLSSGEFIEIQATAEKKAFSKTMLDDLLGLATKGIRELMAMQQDLLVHSG